MRDYRHCNIHGQYLDEHEGCPKCRERETEAAEARKAAAYAATEARDRQQEVLEELRKGQEEAAYRADNPGEFECPACLRISLKRNARHNASKCPLCHADVAPSYWREIDEQEQRRRKAQDEARELAAERERAHQAARARWLMSPEGLAHKAKEADDAAIRERTRKWLRTVDPVSLVAVLIGVVCMCSGGRKGILSLAPLLAGFALSIYCISNDGIHKSQFSKFAAALAGLIVGVIVFGAIVERV